ncbi:MAG: DinB family protein [Acidobacteria bacterium]|nr:MAG: DinB family protein [Acidobacteriota bacterium]
MNGRLADDGQDKPDACACVQGGDHRKVKFRRRTVAPTDYRKVNSMLSQRSNVLAERLEQGARDLAAFASNLTAAQWNTVVPKDGRTVGVIVHHVANMYPIEIQLAQSLANGQPIAGVTWDAVHEINAGHAKEFSGVTKAAALELLQKNSAAAAAAIRGLTSEQLDRASTVSLNDDAPLTCQFFLEDHAVRHSFHHLAVIKRTLNA